MLGDCINCIARLFIQSFFAGEPPCASLQCTPLCALSHHLVQACTPLPEHQNNAICNTLKWWSRCAALLFSDPPFAEGQHTKLEYTSTPTGLLVDYSLQNTLSNKYCEADAGSLAIGTLSSAKCSSMHSLQMPSSAAFISKSKIQIFKSDFSCISAVLQN